jgi:hypothetical protein
MPTRIASTPNSRFLCFDARRTTLNSGSSTAAASISIGDKDRLAVKSRRMLPSLLWYKKLRSNPFKMILMLPFAKIHGRMRDPQRICRCLSIIWGDSYSARCTGRVARHGRCLVLF